MIAIEAGVMAGQKNYSLIASLAIFGITLIVWVHSFVTLNIPIHTNEVALLGLIFVVPAAWVSAAIWVMLDARLWRQLLGVLLLLPGVAIWVLSLMLVSVGFKIH